VKIPGARRMRAGNIFFSCRGSLDFHPRPEIASISKHTAHTIVPEKPRPIYVVASLARRQRANNAKHSSKSHSHTRNRTAREVNARTEPGRWRTIHVSGREEVNAGNVARDATCERRASCYHMSKPAHAYRIDRTDTRGRVLSGRAALDTPGRWGTPP
jgi:hypothetical protein